HLWNVIQSPVITWPGNEFSNLQFSYDVYQHEDLSTDSPGIFHSWSVRSAVDPALIEYAPWQDRTFVYYDDAKYKRFDLSVGDLLVENRTAVQVQLTCIEAGWIWGWWGNDASPAPYFDNVRLVASPHSGPSLITHERNLAQDSFPENGQIDLGNPASMNVRFDAAIAVNHDGPYVAGDSLVCNVQPMRPGSSLTVNRLHYSMNRNPVFDSVRDPSWGITGSVDGVACINGSGIIVPDRFAYDLPDSGFLFPGDVLHYYFEAKSELGGEVLTTILPADIQGFGDFGTRFAYNSSFTMNCLPGLRATGGQPKLLFWDDAGQNSVSQIWYQALESDPMCNTEFDVFRTNNASSGLGNGLGSLATAETMSGYEALFYTSGILANNTLGDGNVSEGKSPDIPLLNQWLALGYRCAFFSGDNLVSDLQTPGSVYEDFLADVLKVDYVGYDIRPLISNQTTPSVRNDPDYPLFSDPGFWITYGGCPSVNTFDAVTAAEGAQRLAQFTDPGGLLYHYSAATLNEDSSTRVISIPYDLSFIFSSPQGGPNARNEILGAINWYFDLVVGECHSSVPEVFSFSANNYPNPFNPSTRIEFVLPQADKVSVKVFNLRGQLVQQLMNDEQPAGRGHVMWNGTNEKGHTVSSGVYFYEVRTSDEAKVGKMMLIK
ncbi:MAG: T9SS type A sorting domain-containing protein, partial [bacterium]|nr:T9SS type A sorting domain-containing protein [bacterium]